MEVPNIGDTVWYVLPSGRFVPAIVVSASDANTVNLTVFAEPEEGQEFACGCAARLRVPRFERKQEDEYPTSGTWFKPTGQFASRT